MEKEERLRARLAELQREVARKEALLNVQRSVEEIILADLDSLLHFVHESKPSNSTGVLAVNDAYPSLRELFCNATLALERAVIKVCVGFETTASDREARLALLRSILGPLEICVTSLCAVQNSSAVTVLHSACRKRAKDLLLASRAFCARLFVSIPKQEPTAAALCGSVEALCAEIRLLPVSSPGAVKRQILEICKTTLQDSAREFTELHEAGGGGAGQDMFGDEEEEEEEEEEVGEEDVARLQGASQCLEALKRFLLSVCKNELEERSVLQLEAISQACKRVDAASMDFSVEMYPKQDVALVTRQASKLLDSVTELLQLVPAQDALFKEFRQNLELVLV